MVDAYFSYLEHLLVLLLAFNNFDPPKDDLAIFIGDTWSRKYNRIFDINKDSVAKSNYDALSSLKERYRNFFSHGGFEKSGDSLWFHVPGIGPLPGNFSKVILNPLRRLLPIENDQFKSIMELFDHVDNHVRNSFSHAMRYIEAMLNVNFDLPSRIDFHTACASEQKFNDLLERNSLEMMRHINYEY